eukprot:m.226197 g.226197  ORF g.226197 m.226197 type:complete len:88 (-) comp15165_c0_seq1:183-446(-)
MTWHDETSCQAHAPLAEFSIMTNLNFSSSQQPKIGELTPLAEIRALKRRASGCNIAIDLSLMFHQKTILKGQINIMINVVTVTCNMS